MLLQGPREAFMGCCAEVAAMTGCGRFHRHPWPSGAKRFLELLRSCWLGILQ